LRGFQSLFAVLVLLLGRLQLLVERDDCFIEDLLIGNAGERHPQRYLSGCTAADPH